jgi:hypothetical protein
MRRRISTPTRRRAFRTVVILFSLLLMGFAISEMFALSAVMVVSSAGLVLTALVAGSLLPPLLATKLKRTA